MPYDKITEIPKRSPLNIFGQTSEIIPFQSAAPSVKEVYKEILNHSLKEKRTEKVTIQFIDIPYIGDFADRKSK